VRKLWLSWLAMPFVLVLSGCTIPFLDKIIPPYRNLCESCVQRVTLEEQEACLREYKCEAPRPSPTAGTPTPAIPAATPTAAPTVNPTPEPSPTSGPPVVCPADPPPYWRVNGAGGPVPWLPKRFKGLEGFGVDATIWMGCDQNGDPAGEKRPPITPKGDGGKLYAPVCDKGHMTPFMAKCCANVEYDGKPHRLDPRGVCISAHGPGVAAVFPQRDKDCNVIAGSEFNGNNWQAFIALIPGMEHYPVRIEASLPPMPVDPLCGTPFRVIGPITRIVTMVPAEAK
jgi:hypothetical protein